jgi:hypothetical protein
MERRPLDTDRWMKIVLIMILFAPLPFAKGFAAEESVEIPPAKIIVDLRAKLESERWLAQAIEQNVYHILRGYNRLIPVNKQDLGASGCAGDDANSCKVDFYHETHSQVLLMGEWHKDQIQYGLFDLKYRKRLASGVIDTSHAKDSKGLKIQIFDALRPALDREGVVDRYLAAAKKERQQAEPTQSSEESVYSQLVQSIQTYKPYFQIGLASLLALVIFGFFLLNLVIHKMGKDISQALRVPGNILLMIALCLALSFVTLNLKAWSPQSFLQLPEVSNWLTRATERFPQAVAAASGLLWAIYLLSYMRYVMRSIPGLEHAHHQVITRVLKMWLGLTSRRLMGMLLTLLFLGAVAAACELVYDFPSATAYGLVFPTIGLFIIFLWLNLLDNMTRVLDRTIIGSQISKQNPWHEKISQYIEREGRESELPLRQKLLDEVLFLPSKYALVATYGGGFRRPRIAIDIKILNYALATEDPDSESKPILAPGGAQDASLKPEKPLPKDALYGLLMSELAEIQFRNYYVETFLLFLRATSKVEGRLSNRSLALLARLFSGNADSLNEKKVLSDTFSALNSALHHHIQYLFYKMYGPEIFQTNGASTRELKANTNSIFNYVKSRFPKDKSILAQLAYRVNWLSKFTPYPLQLPKISRWGAFHVMATFGLFTLAIVFFLKVGEAMDYNPHYNQRITDLKTKIEAFKRKDVDRPESGPKEKLRKPKTPPENSGNL